MPRKRPPLILWLAQAMLVLCGIGLVSAPRAAAQHAMEQQPLYVVVHIDLDSARTDEGLELVKQYVQGCRGDAGNLSMQLLQERGRPNHVTLVEGWRTEQVYLTHLKSRAVVHFRFALQPLLGSPFDERLHYSIGPQKN